MYDHTGIGAALHSKVFLALGLWHNFKQASLLIWKTFALDFIGPAYHCLFPGRDMYMQPKLVHITTILTYLRLSYPRWRQTLLQLHANKDLHATSVNHVNNLTMLMEFLIPTVHPDMVLSVSAMLHVVYHGRTIYLYKYIFVCVQVHDYLVHIKHDMGSHLVKHLWRMTSVFACLRCDLYTVANIQNLHVLTYHRAQRALPFADLVRQDVGIFSEEAGEVSFSLLARSTLGDTVEDKHKRLTDCFRAIGAMKPIRDMHLAGGLNDHDPPCRTSVGPMDPEVVALEQHFLAVLRSLADGSFAYYSSVEALKRSKRYAAPWTSAIKAPLVLDPQSQIHRLWHKVSGLDRNWGMQFADRVGFVLPPDNLTHAVIAPQHTIRAAMPVPINRRRRNRSRMPSNESSSESSDAEIPTLPVSSSRLTGDMMLFIYIN